MVRDSVSSDPRELVRVYWSGVSRSGWIELDDAVRRSRLTIEELVVLADLLGDLHMQLFIVGEVGNHPLYPPSCNAKRIGMVDGAGEPALRVQWFQDGRPEWIDVEEAAIRCDMSIAEIEAQADATGELRFGLEISAYLGPSSDDSAVGESILVGLDEAAVICGIRPQVLLGLADQGGIELLAEFVTIGAVPGPLETDAITLQPPLGGFAQAFASADDLVLVQARGYRRALTRADLFVSRWELRSLGLVASNSSSAAPVERLPVSENVPTQAVAVARRSIEEVAIEIEALHPITDDWIDFGLALVERLISERPEHWTHQTPTLEGPNWIQLGTYICKVLRTRGVELSVASVRKRLSKTFKKRGRADTATTTRSS